MRLIPLFLLVMLYSASIYAQKENQPVSSKIEKVTVFMEGAQVERIAGQTLAPGKYNLVFGGISPGIIKQSIQLKAEGKFTVLSVTNQLNFLKEQEVQEEIKKLELLQEQWSDKIELEKNMKNVYTQEEQLLLKNQAIKGDNSTLKAAELKEAADFQRARLTELYKDLRSNEQNLKKMSVELQKVRKQLVELKQQRELSTSEVIVAVDVKEPTTGQFRLSYLVSQASWFPTYDIRVQSISQPISLQMKANINQQSGEDWKEVKLLLSTGNPNENGTKPNLSPWYLKYYFPIPTTAIRIRGTSSTTATTKQLFGAGVISGIVRDNQGNPVVGATVTAKGTSMGTTTDASGIFTINATPGSTISVTSVGYEVQELSGVNGFANIILQESTMQLQEVIVTGFSSRSERSEDSDFDAVTKTGIKKRKETGLNTSILYQPTSTIFEIKDPYTVPDNGKLYTADINTYELAAQYEYYSVPKLDQSAYLTAKVTDWQELNLLPGEANLFFEGTFLGNSLLDVINAGDTLNLSLGRDKGVVVKRTLLKEYSSKKFLGSNKTDSRQYEIVVRNNKSLPITIIVEDQFPVSTNKDIEIDKLSYDNGKLEEDTKKVSWNFIVEAKKENKVKIAYSVKYPKDKILQLE